MTDSYSFVREMRQTLTRIEDLIDIKYPTPMPVEEVQRELQDLQIRAQSMAAHVETQR